MRFNFLNTALIGLFLTISCMGSASATLIYSEALDGELDAIGSTNVNLVEGTNLIKGSIEATPPADSDRIKFTQVDGLTIDSIVLSFSGTFDDANIGQTMNTALFNNLANLFDDNFNNITSGNSVVASFFDSFGPETGALSKTTAGVIWDFQLSAGIVWPAQPWTLTINTTKISAPSTEVPEPTTLAVFALGMIGMASRRNKR